jgi:diguanylate cyclase (GGDEF)-like protein
VAQHMRCDVHCSASSWRRLLPTRNAARPGHCTTSILISSKPVNDTLGHPIGDRLHQMVARRLRTGTRETDTVARLGGDEFAVLQAGVASPANATELASRLIELIEEPFNIDGHQIVIVSSVGIAFAPQDGLDSDQLMRSADLAL